MADLKMVVARSLLCIGTVSLSRPDVASAETVHLSGLFGYAGEWAFDAYVETQPKSHWWSSTSYAGPLTVRHIGLCTPQGHPAQAGEATADDLGPSGIKRLRLSYGNDTCIISAPLSRDVVSVMRCGNNVQIPIHVWRDPQDKTAPGVPAKSAER